MPGALSGESEPAPCAARATAERERARALELVQAVARCRNEGDECRGAVLRDDDPRTSDDRDAVQGCADERARERASWRSAADGLLAAAEVDCGVLGARQGGRCDGPSTRSLHALVLGAIERSAGVVSSEELIETLSLLLDAAAQAGSVAPQLPFVGAMVGQAVSASQTVRACAMLPRWRAGEGLTTVAFPGARVVIDVPEGAVAAPVAITPPAGLPIEPGFTTLDLDAVASSLPEGCHLVEDESASTARVIDCAGPRLYSPHRELWAVIEAGSQRLVVSQRIRHQSDRVTVQAAAALLRTARAAEGSGPIVDVGALGARGSLEGWPVAYVSSGVLHLGQRVVPASGDRIMTLSRLPDATICGNARAVPPGLDRVVLEDAPLHGAGCLLSAFWGDRFGPRLHVLRVEPFEGGWIAVQLLTPADDEASARAALADAHRQIATVRTPPPRPRRR